MKGGALDEEFVSDAAAREIVSLGHYDYNDLPALYRSHDVFVFPSVSETFGHPMAEAMSSGLPVLVCQVLKLIRILSKVIAKTRNEVGSNRRFFSVFRK